MSPKTEKDTDSLLEKRREELRRRRVVQEQKRDAIYARKKAGGTFEEETFFARVLRGVLWAAGLLQRGRENAAHPVLRELAVPIADLPVSFEGYKLLHISDLHFSTTLGLSDAAARLLASVPCDVCVITGDFLWGKTGPCEPVFRNAERLVRHIRAQDGIFAVLGNHDRSFFIEPLERCGIQVLLNNRVPIVRNGDRIWLAGIDDPAFFKTADIAAALHGVPDEEVAILLAHSPDMAKEAAAYGVKLYLCGHTHAGQICFPYIGAFHYNCRAPRAICRGLWCVGDMMGYTTAGLGTTELPVRYNCPPEAAVLTLQRTA
ncbi:MAG TPA: metallophosphoesterase [Candidatus Hydrogenedentes bacterium]|nr:metallophosphoesterase [Candidatus Hydrogenedentota bacterium]HOL78105.1 metallophosphoesterase [Candidatus Hydrogenedentota bacterium]HPO86472.1 metallophosphoesterase [Candidatus Hydrogenedentota bacterium]